MVILQQIKSKLYKSALLQKQDLNKRLAVMKGNRGKVTTLKWGDLELKIDSMCPFVRIAWWNFPSEGNFNSAETWYWLCKEMSYVHSKLSWVAAVFWARGDDVPSLPHVGPHMWIYIEGKMSPYTALLMQPQYDLPGCGKGHLVSLQGASRHPEFTGQKLDHSNHEGLSSCLTENSWHSLASSC